MATEPQLDRPYDFSQRLYDFYNAPVSKCDEIAAEILLQIARVVERADAAEREPSRVALAEALKLAEGYKQQLAQAVADAGERVAAAGREQDEAREVAREVWPDLRDAQRRAGRAEEQLAEIAEDLSHILKVGQVGKQSARRIRTIIRDIAAASVAGGEPSKDKRDRVCVAAWPECEEGMYDPRCCRFPKSCSCTVVAGGEPGTEQPR